MTDASLPSLTTLQRVRGGGVIILSGRGTAVGMVSPPGRAPSGSPSAVCSQCSRRYETVEALLLSRTAGNIRPARDSMPQCHGSPPSARGGWKPQQRLLNSQVAVQRPADKELSHPVSTAHATSERRGHHAISTRCQRDHYRPKVRHLHPGVIPR
jgi:hypothetical protein